MSFTAELISEDFNPTLQSDGRIVRTYRDVYLAKSDTRMSGMEVLSAIGVRQGDTHRDDGLASLRSCPVKRRFTRQAPFTYDVTLEYSTDAPQVQSQNSDDPTQLRVKRWWSTTEEQRYIIRDRNGVLIVNTAKEPPKGGIAVNVELPMLTYERNESDFSGAVAKLWSGSINQSAWAGWDPGQVKLKVTGEEIFEQKHHYWRVRYEFVCDEDGWQPRWVNAGVREWDPINSKQIPILDENLQPVTEAVPLDSSGFEIAAIYLPESAVFNTVDYRRSMEFQKLGLSEF